MQLLGRRWAFDLLITVENVGYLHSRLLHMLSMMIFEWLLRVRRSVVVKVVSDI